MASHEEQNEQPMRRWHVRHAREREDLSASVEEALTDPSGKIPAEKGLIRPRLSLQSRPIHAVRLDRAVEDNVRAVAGNDVVMPPGNMLTRLAQRISSLLPVVTPPEGSAPAGPLQARVEGRVERISPPDTNRHPIPARASARRGETGVSRAANVRRQTMTMPRVVLLPVEDDVELPTPEVRPVPRPAETRTTDAHVHAIALPEGAGRGGGVFEPGQGEIMVMHTQVTLNSIVLVNFIANPGPVLVQYISLHPQVGFTIHLTAPVVVRAAFNYMLF